MSLNATQETPSFHPSIMRWFADTFGEPTPVQKASWPLIATGHNLLITAPTGSGKTLTAFLWSLSQHASAGRDRASGHTRVLYVSPLKALNNDIQRNLNGPLAALEADYDYPKLRVATRSGDTSQTDRQRMLRHPPDILITTPESLGLLLTTLKGRQALAQVEVVILDEIHAIVDNRRGVALMANLERLAGIAGEFQRIALSATVNPLEQVADYVAGRTEDGSPRPIEVVNAAGAKRVHFEVRFPAEASQAAEAGQKIWEPLSKTFREVIQNNNATLFFTNSRRLAEKITLKVNQTQPEPLAYAHHGSLAREVRQVVEQRLKEGELRAIVATNSLEMGIDIGDLDRVVLIQSPPSVAATLQRIGRAGHGVGEVSRGTLFPTHAHDFLEAAALGTAVAERDIEPQQLMSGALDVLAQLIISICATDAWPVDDLYRLIRRATPYAGLAREHFDLVIDMLAGRYAGTRIRELKPKIVHDRIAQTVKATKAAVLNFYNSGGTIPDRGYFKLKHVDTGAAIGELDEEFVWEASIGDTFTFGTAHWQIQRITHNDVIVRPAKPGASLPPFFRSEFFNRSFHFSHRIAGYLEMTEERLANKQQQKITEHLLEVAGFDSGATTALIDYLSKQRDHTNTALPHAKHVVLELVNSGPGGYQGPDDPQQLVIHTIWGGRLNQPWALALRSAWQATYGSKLDIHADNDALVLQAKQIPDPHEILSLVSSENLLTWLRASLEASGFFGARFRECAGRSLLLTKQRFNQRLPLWMSRMQAKKLMAQVKKLDDFPVMLETWRTCLDDEFDIPALTGQLDKLANGEIDWSYVSTSTPSPFARDLTFGQISPYMYADDTPEDEDASALSTDLINEALHNPQLRPRIEREVIAEFEAKRQRRAPGYEPTSEEEWQEWLKERVLIPDHELPADFQIPANAVWVDADDGRRWATHNESLFVLHDSGLVTEPPAIEPPDLGDPRSALMLAREVLSFYGPLTTLEAQALLPTLPEGTLDADDAYVRGALVADDEAVYGCDAENFEILMRFARAARRSTLSAQPVTRLPNFWAILHRAHATHSEQNLVHAIETLRLYQGTPESWFNDLMRTRVEQFAASDWTILQEQYGLAWRGSGKEKITFAYPEELALLSQGDAADDITDHFADPNARYSFQQILESSEQTTTDLNDKWWQAVWNGRLAADVTTPLQQGFERKYTMSAQTRQTSSRRRLRRAPKGWSGHWYLTQSETIDDPLSRLERDKDIVRLLLDRYGILNRDLVVREKIDADRDSPWRWRDAFRALRIMELSGEVVMGHFFDGTSTPQFATPRAVSMLTSHPPSDPNFFVSALDPIAPCGLSLDWPELPQRRQGNYLVFHAGKLALTLEGYGRAAHYHVPWDHEAIDEINGVFRHIVKLRRKRVNLTTINNKPALDSQYIGGIERAISLSRDHRGAYIEAGLSE